MLRERCLSAINSTPKKCFYESLTPTHFLNTAEFLPYASAFCCIVLAVSAFYRARSFVDRWAFGVGMLILSGDSILTSLAYGAGSADSMARWEQWKLAVMALLPGTWLVFSRSYSRDVNQNEFSRVRLPWAIAAIAPLGLMLLCWDSLIVSWQRIPTINSWVVQFGWPALGLHAFLLVASVGVLINLEGTFRAAVGTMRWRIKYMLLGVGLIFVGRLYTSSQVLLFRGADLSIEAVNPAATLVGCLLIARAMFREGHFDLQVYPSQSVLQGSLAALLAGLYLLIVGVLAKVVTLLGGDASFAFKTLVILVSIVLLALLLQSDHVRLRMRRMVSRHFSRPVFDYRTVWRKFTEGTANQMDQPELCAAFSKLVGDVFQALSVSVWLVDQGKGVVALGSSTAQSSTQRLVPEIHQSSMGGVIRYFQEHPEPLEFESIQTDWAVTLRAWHPSEFRAGGSRVCIPIVSRGELLGLITVGDRVGGVAYSFQDFDMFRCIAEHAAANLLNLTLSRKLLQAKELESFQKMAAFFVHDLKNAASTLSLMLKNLPVHFDNPEFREDALRGIAKTVTRINDLTGRLNTLRHEMKLKFVESDINELVSNAVSAVQFGPDVSVTQNLSSLPRLNLDREQIGKLMVNLLLNAAEAMDGHGKLHISTGIADGRVVVAIADTGCGMSAEFVSQSLFHPFQTTKKNGFGIGMFQCKAIVEAHGGKITVVSKPANGTVFNISLPIPE